MTLYVPLFSGGSRATVMTEPDAETAVAGTERSCAKLPGRSARSISITAPVLPSVPEATTASPNVTEIRDPTALIVADSGSGGAPSVALAIHTLLAGSARPKLPRGRPPAGAVYVILGVEVVEGVAAWATTIEFSPDRLYFGAGAGAPLPAPVTPVTSRETASSVPSLTVNEEALIVAVAAPTNVMTVVVRLDVSAVILRVYVASADAPSANPTPAASVSAAAGVAVYTP